MPLQPLVRILPVLCAALFITVAAPAQDVLPDRPLPERNEDAKDRTKQAIDAVSEKWEDDRNPSILLTVGIQSKDKIVYNVRSQLVDRISSPLKRHLRDATDRRSVVVPSMKELRDKNISERLSRDAGKALPEGAAAILKKEYRADLIFDVTLLSTKEPGRYALNMKVYDTRADSEIASDSLSTVGTDTTEARGVAIADAIIRSFAREYAQNTRSDRPEFTTYSLKLIGLEQEGGIGQKAIRDIVGKLEADKRVKWAEPEFTGIEDTGLAVIEARFGGRQTALLDLIERDILPALKLSWRLQQTDDATAVAYIYPNTIPSWFAITDTDAPDFAETLKQRSETLVRDGLPKLGIIVGQDFDEPLTAFDAVNDAPVSFELQALEGALQDQFAQMNFRVVDNTTLRSQLKRKQGNAIRYDNLPHMLDAIGDLESVDLVLHINMKPGGNALNARLIEVSSAQVIGFHAWDPTKTSRLQLKKVNSKDPEAVARYLTGQMLVRYDRFAGRQERTLEIQVRNIESADAILSLATRLKDSLSPVRSVVDLQAVTPVSSFELVFDGDRSEMTFAAIQLVGEDFPNAEVQVIGDSLIINAAPKTVSEKKAKERKAELEKQLAGVIGVQEVKSPVNEGVTPPVVAPPVANSGDSFRQKLLAARYSVFVVGIEYEGRFSGMGTLWQVQEGVLATNGHVVIGLAKERAKMINKGIPKEKISYVALGGPEHDHRLTLQLETVIHPKYVEHEQRWNQFLSNVHKKDGEEMANKLAVMLPIAGGDVALMFVAEGKSRPSLPLASQDTLENKIIPTDPIAYIGFPSENLAKLTNLGKPAQQIDLGTVMSVTDFDQAAGTPQTRQLIHNDIVADGGASGSPIFNEQGEVVSVLSAGSIVFLNKGASPGSVRVRTGVVYSQRVDLVKDLLAGKGLKLNPDQFIQPANEQQSESSQPEQRQPEGQPDEQPEQRPQERSQPEQGQPQGREQRQPDEPEYGPRR
ncbi:MAG: trypsin-like peptidase domain-containing protein [Phycisphaeraceae bacterium]